jgi:hypothetical protein
MADWREGLKKLPEYMHGGVERYIEHGIPPGSFLTAVLCNDLKGAFMSADTQNSANLRNLVEFIYWDMPAGAQGSLKKVEAWIAHHGLSGLGKETEDDAEPAGVDDI